MIRSEDGTRNSKPKAVQRNYELRNEIAPHRMHEGDFKMRNYLAFTILLLAATPALSTVVCAQADHGQAGQQPAANPARGGGRGRREAAPSPTANLPFDPHDFSGVWM